MLRLISINTLRTLIIIGSFGALSALADVGQSTFVKDDTRWIQIRNAVFENQKIVDGESILSIDAPERAQDPSNVPISVQFINPDIKVEKLSIVVDQNPAPVAAEIEIDPSTPMTALNTKIRVNEFSMVRAIAKASDGQTYMVARHVKATGGCSADNIEEVKAMASKAGQMELSVNDSNESTEATLNIFHPNFTGQQLDQLTLLYIPAFFVNQIELDKEGTPIIKIKTNFSLSANPEITFDFSEKNYLDSDVKVKVTDSKNEVFESNWNPENQKLDTI